MHKHFHLFDELFSIGLSTIYHWNEIISLKKSNEKNDLFRSEWIMGITAAFYHNRPFKSQKQMARYSKADAILHRTTA